MDKGQGTDNGTSLISPHYVQTKSVTSRCPFSVMSRYPFPSYGGIAWRGVMLQVVGSFIGNGPMAEYNDQVPACSCQKWIGAMSMTVSQATAEVFLTALRALPDEERQAVLARIVEDEQWQEDLKDLAVLSQRRNESSRPFREFLEEHGS